VTNRLDEEVSSGESRNKQDQYEFARILKEKQAVWKDKTHKIKNDFKELLQEYSDLQAKYETETATLQKHLSEVT